MSEQASDSSAFLNVMCLLKYVLNCEQHFSFFMFRSGLSDIRVNCNRIIEGSLYSYYNGRKQMFTPKKT
jgi:hypothetical protein